MEPRDVAAIILAAGAGSRFGEEPKLLADLDGRPVLQHVLDAVDAFTPAETVVVLGHAADRIEAGVTWRAERRVTNPDPGRGLSSSVRVGLEALAGSRAAAALIVLGDQPQVSVAVMGALLAEARAQPERPIVVPLYASDGGRNPVLLRHAAWPLAAALSGDRGFGPLIAAHPELVAEVAVEGDNPDIDTPADLQSRRSTSPIRPNGGRGSV